MLCSSVSCNSGRPCLTDGFWLTASFRSGRPGLSGPGKPHAATIACLGYPFVVGLRALKDELVAVIRRHAPDWTAPSVHDLGISLGGVFAWLADTRARYSDQVADAAALS